MKGYEYLQHTADVKFRAYGESLEKAFENAAFALADVIADHSKVKPKVEKEINIGRIVVKLGLLEL